MKKLSADREPNTLPGPELTTEAIDLYLRNSESSTFGHGQLGGPDCTADGAMSRIPRPHRSVPLIPALLFQLQGPETLFARELAQRWLLYLYMPRRERAWLAISSTMSAKVEAVSARVYRRGG